MKNLLFFFLVLLALGPARAERADRDKPIQLEAQRVTIDDVKKTQELEGDVVLTQGTLVIQAERIIVVEDAYGFQKGTAFAGKEKRVHFRQKREGKDEIIEGEAERIEYDTRTEIAQFFQHAWVKSGEDQVQGDYIRYDSVSEKYLVTAQETRDPKAPPSRVRGTLQPRRKDAPPAPAEKAPALELKGADGLAAQPLKGEGGR